MVKAASDRSDVSLRCRFENANKREADKQEQDSRAWHKVLFQGRFDPIA